MKKKFSINGEQYTISDYKRFDDSISFELEGEVFTFKKHQHSRKLVLEHDKQLHYAQVCASTTKSRHILVDGLEFEVEALDGRSQKQAQKKGGMLAPMPAKIFKVLVNVGDRVEQGQSVVVLEAMKMEHTIKADKSGTVASLSYKVGDMVKTGAQLLSIEEEES